MAELAAETAAAAAAGAAFAVITGGEPLHHDLTPLCEALATSGLPLHLETSGVDPLSGSFSWITLSPKPHRPPTAELLAACDELKVVVASDATGWWNLQRLDIGTGIRVGRATAGTRVWAPFRLGECKSAIAMAALGGPVGSEGVPTGRCASRLCC